MKMKIRKNFIYLLVGVIIGFAAFLLFGAIMSHYDPGTFLTEHPKRFGDTKIWAFTADALWRTDEKYSNVGKVLLMKRNDAPFLYAETDKDGKITDIAITDENKNVRFKLKTLKSSGKWGNAMYCRDKGYFVGEFYHDFDFDGQFDTKALYDKNGERVSRHIYIGDGVWKEAQHIERGKAAVDDKFYIFSNDFGWQRNK